MQPALRSKAGQSSGRCSAWWIRQASQACLIHLGVADQVIPEPEGGAHNDPKAVFAAVDRALTRHLGQLLREKDLSAHRYQKFRAMGAVLEETET